MRIDRLTSLVVATAAAALVAGCDTARPVATEGTGGITGCSSCHTGPGDTGTFRGVAGGSGASVGAHSRHLGAGFSCEACHVVPATVAQTGHQDGDGRAEIALGTVAGAGATFTPAAGGGGSCSSVYCHGATLEGGTTPTPSWSAAPGSLGCTGCHASPPANHGAAVLNCVDCHAATLDGNTTIKAGGGHVNGEVFPDLDITPAGCTFCHSNGVIASSPGRAAPDQGAHLVHLQGGALSGPVACTECHVIPTTLGHVSTPPTPDLTFGARAAQDVPAPGPTYSAGTCTVYCHGVTLFGDGSNTAPRWTAGAGQADCGTCHTLPPPAPHPTLDRNGDPFPADPAQARLRCTQCHPGTVNALGNIETPALHVNGVRDVTFHPQAPTGPNGEPAWQTRGLDGMTPHGKAALFSDARFPNGLQDCAACHGADFAGGIVGVSCNDCHANNTYATYRKTPDWKTDCTWCHGDPQRSGDLAKAPPFGTKGESATSARAVGVHQKHLGQGVLVSTGVTCVQCHANVTDLVHVNKTPVLTFGPLASQGTTATFDTGALTCANYCHGATLPGTGRAAPVWTAANTINLTTCGSCHQASPTSGQHPAVESKHSSFGCTACHPANYASATASKALHVNGTRDVNTGSPTFWNPQNRTCAAACHGGQSFSW